MLVPIIPMKLKFSVAQALYLYSEESYMGLSDRMSEVTLLSDRYRRTRKQCGFCFWFVWEFLTVRITNTHKNYSKPYL